MHTQETEVRIYQPQEIAEVSVGVGLEHSAPALVIMPERNRITPEPEMRSLASAAGYGAPGFADVAWLYRLLSAFAHGKEWSLFGTAMGPPVANVTPGLHRERVTGSDTVIVGATSRVALCVETAIVEVERYLREP